MSEGMVKNTTYERDSGGYIAFIDIKNYKHLYDVSKMVEKQEAKRLNIFSNGMLHYWVKEKLE